MLSPYIRLSLLAATWATVIGLAMDSTNKSSQEICSASEVEQVEDKKLVETSQSGYPSGLGALPYPAVPLPSETKTACIHPVQPVFPGCEDLAGYADRKACEDKRLLEFVYSNLNWPNPQGCTLVSGTVVITFVVEKDGRISSPEIRRDINGGFGQEVLRVVQLIQTENIIWEPGKQDGEPVRIQLTLPIRINLQ